MALVETSVQSFPMHADDCPDKSGHTDPGSGCELAHKQEAFAPSSPRSRILEADQPAGSANGCEIFRGCPNLTWVSSVLDLGKDGPGEYRYVMPVAYSQFTGCDGRWNSKAADVAEIGEIGDFERSANKKFRDCPAY